MLARFDIPRQQKTPGGESSPIRVAQVSASPLARKIFVEAALKDADLRRGLREQGHRRAELHLVDRAEDIPRSLAFNIERETGAFPQPRPKDRVREIGLRLVERGDREADRHRALAEACDLGKDEPHPVALLSPGLKFLTHSIVGRRLRIDEAFEVERIRHAPPRKDCAEAGVPGAAPTAEA